MVFRIARQSLGDRPVYFAGTASPVWDKWQLQPHLVRHGLAFKLVDGPLEVSGNLVDLREQFPDSVMPTWNDPRGTRELLEDVFLVDDLLELEEWPEPSTRSSIPLQYYLAHAVQGLTEEVQGTAEAAQEAYRRANHFARLLGGG
ncbi:hypothetical protein [Candidatus Palauibacter sp.]|uniref:hypothetical protein n=1 Tax=Candidatus Palauibacter sp. TaxID=3101350 RepID=UPI003C6EF076